jgi:tRNA-(guanine-N1)-methyltransferase
MRFDILTIFPKMVSGKAGDCSYFGYSILKRAQEKKLITIRAHDVREFATDKHRKVDDSPYGGGAGMVIKVEPVYRAVLIFKPHNLKNQTVSLE